MSVRELEPRDYEGLARLFNESEEGWPGGFTGGTKLTARVIEDWVRRTRAIAHLIVKEEGRVLGYLMLTSHWRDPDACYVALLNVHPEARGRGFGKRLLLRAIELARERGFNRLDLHTWSGNARAIGLYKRTGFFWVPGTSVYMQNYVPLLLRVLGRYLEGVDWYSAFSRRIEVEEDRELWRGREVFTYTWRLDGGEVVAKVDWEAKLPCYVSTPDFEAELWSSERRPLKSFDFELRFRAVNRGGKPLQVSAIAEPPSGIKLDRRAWSLEVKPGEEVELSLSARALKDAAEPLEEYEEEALILKVVASLLGVEIPLAVGLRPRAPVEVELHPSPIAALAGVSRRVKLVVHNRSGKRAKVRVALEGIEASPREFELEFEGGAAAARDLTVKVSRRQRGEVRVSARFEGGASYEAREEVSVKPLLPGGVLGSIEYGGREVIFESPTAKFSVRLQGGWLDAYRDQRWIARLFSDSVGPPFRPSRLRYARYRVVELGDRRLVLEAEVPGYGGLLLRKAYEFLSDELVRASYELVNVSGEEREVQLEVYSWSLRCVGSFYAGGSGAASWWYTAAGEYPAGEEDVKGDPEGLAVYDSGRFRIGLSWSPESCERALFSWSPLPYLRFRRLVLKPLSSARLPPIYLYVGERGVEDVRKLLLALSRGEDVKPAKPEKAVSLEPRLLRVESGASREVTLKVRWERGRQLRGELRLRPGPRLSVEPPSASVDGGREVRVRVGCSPAESPYLAHLDWELALDGLTPSGRIYVLATRGGSKAFRREEVEGFEVLVADNGWLKVKAAPKFGGCIFAVEEGGVNRLATSFPKPGPYGWVSPWYGGVRLRLSPSQKKERSYEEEWKGRFIEAGDWLGVELSAELGRSYEELRGLRATLRALTLPGFRLVVLDALVDNVSAPVVDLTALLSAWLDVKEARIVVPNGGGELRLEPKVYGVYPMQLARSWWVVVSSGPASYAWSARSSRDVIVGAILDSAKDFPAVYVDASAELAPGDRVRVLALLALCSSEDEALRAARAAEAVIDDYLRASP